jgi:hypothetical protein
MVTVPAVIPPSPVIAAVSPGLGLAGTAVVISGANFGATQGGSSLTFNGTSAVPTSWSTTSIAAPVPGASTTGPVRVTVNGLASNAITFSVFTMGSLAGAVTRLSDGSPLVGATIQALQSGIVKGATTSGSGGSYSIPSLLSGAYDVRTSASGFVTDLKTSVALSGSSTVLNMALSVPGAIAGQVTASGASTPIAAGISVSRSGIVVATTSADAAGNYGVGGLTSGIYAVQAAAVGYSVGNVTGLVVAEGATSPANIALGLAPTAAVRYSYDEVGRLRSVTNLAGDTAVFSYDAVGNTVSIGTYASSSVSVVNFTPSLGPVGTAVTISGTGFSAVPSENSVQFNGVASAITSATSTQIVATVPVSASTGPISVNSPSGSATSGGSFAVGPSSAPTVTHFAPAVASAGTAVTITGTNFSPVAAENVVKVNVTGVPVTSSTSTSLSTTISPGARSGRIVVASVSGLGASTGHLFVSPNPCAIGALPYPAVPCPVLDIVSTAAVPSLGTPTPIAVNSGGKFGLVVFDGVAGQRLRVVVALPGTTAWSSALYGAPLVCRCGFDPHVIGQSGGGSISMDIDLPYSGSYTLALRPWSTADVGTATVTVTACAPSGC